MAKKHKKTGSPEIVPKEKKIIPGNVENNIQVIDLFEKLGGKAWLAALGLLFLITVIVFKDYLFLAKIYLFKDIACDSYNLTYPNLYNTADYIAKHGVPKWSFASGMGQNIFPFFLRDPFDIFLYLIGKNHIAYGLAFVEVTKIILAGLVFFFYLKQLKFSGFTSLTGALLFAFCGYMMEGSGWYIFTYEALNFAVLLLAFELLFNKGNWYLFPIAIFGMAISMPFNLYVYGIFLAFYVVLRHLQASPFDIKKLGVLYLKMFGLGVIGLLLAGPFLLENILQLIESPRGSGNTSLSNILSAMPMFDFADKLEFGTGIMRLFSTDMLYSGDNFKGWQNILEAPMYYCGLPCLLLMPQVFGLLSKRVRITFIVFLLVWLLPMFFPYFRHAFWLFTGDYYRAYSFFVAIVLIFYSLHALEYILQKRSINLMVLIASVVGFLLLLNYPFFEDKETVNSAMQVFVAMMLLAYGVVLYLLGKKGENVNFRYIFLGMLVIELCYMAGVTINERNAMTPADQADKIGYNDYTVNAADYAGKNDKSFFRIDKTYSSGLSRFATMNDAMVQNYYGTSSYNPFNQLYYIRYLQLYDIAQKGNELDSRWARSLVSKPILECQNRVKYMLGKGNNINPFWRFMCDSLTTLGDVKVFQNKNILPWGFTYDRFMRESVFTRLSSIQKEFVSLRTCVIQDKDVPQVVPGLKEFSLSDTFSIYIFTPDSLVSEIKELKKDSMSLVKFGETFVEGNIDINEDRIMYISIPYDDGWQLKVDGQPRNKIIINSGMTGIFLSKGKHNIAMNYDLHYFSKGVLMSIFGILVFIGLWFFQKKFNKKEITNIA